MEICKGKINMTKLFIKFNKWFLFQNKQHKWARQRLGGKWEKWYIDLPMPDIWFQVEDWSENTKFRPGCGRCIYIKEEYK